MQLLINRSGVLAKGTFGNTQQFDALTNYSVLFFADRMFRAQRQNIKKPNRSLMRYDFDDADQLLGQSANVSSEVQYK